MEEKETLEGTTEVSEEQTAEKIEAEFAAESAEKESTVELRANYEEALSEPESPKKKKLSKKKLIIIIVASVLVAALLGFLLWFFIPSGPASTADNLVLTPGKPSVTAVIPADIQAKVDLALAPTATDAQKQEAFIALYNLANQNKIDAAQCVMVAQGSGSALVAKSAGGTMTVRAFKVQANGEYYYQKGAKLMEVTMGKKDVIEKVLDKQERAYCSADKKTCRAVTLSGSTAQVDGDSFSTYIPFLKLGSRYKKDRLLDEFKATYTYDEFAAATFISEGGDCKEINNFKYASTDSIREVQSFTYDAKEGYYDITVVVEVTDEATVSASREYLRQSADSKDLEYKKYVLNVKIWDNGYIRSFRDEEEWAGNATIIGSIKGESSSETWYEAAFYYDYKSLTNDGIVDKKDKTITKTNFAKDIIDKYAKEVEWVK